MKKIFLLLFLLTFNKMTAQLTSQLSITSSFDKSILGCGYKMYSEICPNEGVYYYMPIKTGSNSSRNLIVQYQTISTITNSNNIVIPNCSSAKVLKTFSCDLNQHEKVISNLQDYDPNNSCQQLDKYDIYKIKIPLSFIPTQDYFGLYIVDSDWNNNSPKVIIPLPTFYSSLPFGVYGTTFTEEMLDLRYNLDDPARNCMSFYPDFRQYVDFLFNNHINTFLRKYNIFNSTLNISLLPNSDIRRKILSVYCNEGFGLNGENQIPIFCNGVFLPEPLSFEAETLECPAPEPELLCATCNDDFPCQKGGRVNYYTADDYGTFENCTNCAAPGYKSSKSSIAITLSSSNTNHSFNLPTTPIQGVSPDQVFSLTAMIKITNIPQSGGILMFTTGSRPNSPSLVVDLSQVALNTWVPIQSLVNVGAHVNNKHLMDWKLIFLPNDNNANTNVTFVLDDVSIRCEKGAKLEDYALHIGGKGCQETASFALDYSGVAPFNLGNSYEMWFKIVDITNNASLFRRNRTVNYHDHSEFFSDEISFQTKVDNQPINPRIAFERINNGYGRYNIWPSEALNSWNHIAVTFHTSSNPQISVFKIFLNGMLIKELDGYSGVSPGFFTENFLIGSEGNLMINDFRVYNRYLLPAEIYAQYMTGMNQVSLYSADVVHEYTMNQRGGRLILDSGGNINGKIHSTCTTGNCTFPCNCGYPWFPVECNE